MTDKLYRSHSLEFSDEGTSGSLTIWENSPVSPFNVGDTFRPVPQSPALTVDKVSIKDNVIGEANGKTVRQWEITIEGSNFHNDGQQQETPTHVKYNFNISADEKSGSMEVHNDGDNPAITLDVGDTFNVPGIGEVFCSNIKGNDDYDDDGIHSWTVIYEGANKAVILESDIKYSLSIENNSDGVTIYSGSKEFTCTGDVPTIGINIGDKFSLPLVGELTCTKIHSTNDDANLWTVTIEGSRGGAEAGGDDDEQGLPENEASINYEINGSTVRSVAGEFIVLRRSETPINKKSFTIHTYSGEHITAPGSTYQGGIVTSVNISKETIKNNGIVTATYYKHQIEVES